MIGKGNWCAIVSDWCLDYWKPLDIPIEAATQDIFPTVEEVNFGITKCHLVDDYTVSNNIARYGLKHVLIPEFKQKFPQVRDGLLAHQYLKTTTEKIVYLKDMLKKWNLE